MPLVRVRVNSRGELQPTVRGMESRRIVVLVDGIPVTLGWDNRADLSVVPLTAAREVTLIRGLSSVLHGPNAAGGVVKVGITDAPPALLYTGPIKLNAGLDHLGSSATELAASMLFRREAGVLFIGGGGGYRKRSEFPRPSDVSRAVPGAGGDRLNSDIEHGNGFVVGRYESGGGAWAALSSFGFRAEKGVPPELHVLEPRLWRIPKTWRWVTVLSGGTGWRGTRWGEGDLEARVGLDFGETEIDTYESLADDRITGGESGDDRTLTFRVLGDHTLGPGILSGALTLAETRHVEVLDPGGQSTFRQRLLSFGVEIEEPLGGAGGHPPGTRLSLGLSVDGSDTPETGGQPPGGVLWDWGARAGVTTALGDRGVLAHGGLSRRVRFPSLRELYSGALGRFVVNPDLDPEVLVAAELGVTARIGGLETQAVGFHQRLSDAIVRSSLGDGRFQRVNRDRTLSTGLELLANYAWKRLWVAGDLTLQNVELSDPTAPAEQRRSEHQPWVAGNLAVRASTILGIQAGVRLSHVGRHYCVHPDLGTDVELQSSTWVDFEVSRVFRPGGAPGARRAEAILALDNSTDGSAFDQCGLPQPGRILRLQLRLF